MANKESIVTPKCWIIYVTLRTGMIIIGKDALNIFLIAFIQITINQLIAQICKLNLSIYYLNLNIFSNFSFISCLSISPISPSSPIKSFNIVVLNSRVFSDNHFIL